MSQCPLCGGKGKLPDRAVHFGDGVYEQLTCTYCDGKGVVEIEIEQVNRITIIKPHGIWGDSRNS